MKNAVHSHQRGAAVVCRCTCRMESEMKFNEIAAITRRCWIIAFHCVFSLSPALRGPERKKMLRKRERPASEKKWEALVSKNLFEERAADACMCATATATAMGRVYSFPLIFRKRGSWFNGTIIFVYGFFVLSPFILFVLMRLLRCLHMHTADTHIHRTAISSGRFLAHFQSPSITVAIRNGNLDIFSVHK